MFKNEFDVLMQYLNKLQLWIKTGFLVSRRSLSFLHLVLYLNLDCALTGERFTKNTVSIISCDSETCFILNNANSYSASKTTLIYSSLLLQIFADSITLIMCKSKQYGFRSGAVWLSLHCLSYTSAVDNLCYFCLIFFMLSSLFSNAL